jgi:Zn-dependent protease
LTAAGQAVILTLVILSTLAVVATHWLTGAASGLSDSSGSLVGVAALGAQLGSVAAVAGHVAFTVVALILCVAVHEFGHAYVADRLGDPLPRMQGRVTLNPLAHIDLLGTVLFPALMALGVGIPLAWGKPVQISESARHLTRRFSLRTIRLMISVAGPAMNLALALLLSLVFVVVARLAGSSFLREHILQLVALNFGLLFFNLLPIPPLDGRSLLAFLPDSLAAVRDLLTRYGGFIFLALIFIGGIGQGPGPLYYIMLPFTLLTRAYLGWLLQLGGLG